MSDSDVKKQEASPEVIEAAQATEPAGTEEAKAAEQAAPVTEAPAEEKAAPTSAESAPSPYVDGQPSPLGESPIVTPAADAPAENLDADRAAKVKAAAEARAARAAAKAAAAPKAEGEGAAAPAAAADADAAPPAPKEPSPKQPVLDRLVAILKEELGEDSVLEAAINERDDHLPSIVLDVKHLPEAARLMRDHPELQMNYLRNVSGSDMETHMEVMYHILALDRVQEYAVKVKTDRDAPSVPSVTPIWDTANWNEREIYDLLGIDFPGHPDLRRIMMSDDWVGHPLRKDYEPLDPEV